MLILTQAGRPAAQGPSARMGAGTPRRARARPDGRGQKGQKGHAPTGPKGHTPMGAGTPRRARARPDGCGHARTGAAEKGQKGTPGWARARPDVRGHARMGAGKKGKTGMLEISSFYFSSTTAVQL